MGVGMAEPLSPQHFTELPAFLSNVELGSRTEHHPLRFGSTEFRLALITEIGTTTTTHIGYKVKGKSSSTNLITAWSDEEVLQPLLFLPRGLIFEYQAKLCYSYGFTTVACWVCLCRRLISLTRGIQYLP